MKKIMFSFNKDTDEMKDDVELLVARINKNFEIIEDDNEYETLRYITINADLVLLTDEQIGFGIRSIIQPHKFVSIPNHLLWKVEVKLQS